MYQLWVNIDLCFRKIQYTTILNGDDRQLCTTILLTHRLTNSRYTTFTIEAVLI